MRPWGVFLEDRLIGHGGLNYVPEFDETEVLWALHPDAWGNGYATEVARAALGYGFDTLGLELIFAITLPDNHASQAVMKRLGLTYRRQVEYKGFKDIVWFDIDRRLGQPNRVILSVARDPCGRQDPSLRSDDIRRFAAALLRSARNGAARIPWRRDGRRHRPPPAPSRRN